MTHTIARPAAAASAHHPHPGWSKVPQITVLFWVVKVLTTGMGEAASDYLAGVDIALAAGVGALGLVVTLALQLAVRRYIPAIYWAAVAMVAVFGTMAADGVHVVLGVPYPVTTVLYAVALAVIFLVWRRVEGTCDIHTIDTRRRELFYWATVLATFALGTAAGDLTAYSMNLGYLASAVFFAGLIALPPLARRIGWIGEVAAFWACYVLTRPLGASIADWLGKPPEKGSGLDLGDGPVTLVALALIVVLVAVLTAHQRRTDRTVAQVAAG